MSWDLETMRRTLSQDEVTEQSQLLHPKRSSTRADGQRGDRRLLTRTLWYGHGTYTYKKGPFIYTIEGCIWDLSESGCSIRGTMSPMAGERVKILLSLSREEEPLSLKGAIVAWVVRGSFGVRFKLTPKECNRLRHHVQALTEKQSCQMQQHATPATSSRKHDVQRDTKVHPKEAA